MTDETDATDATKEPTGLDAVLRKRQFIDAAEMALDELLEGAKSDVREFAISLGTDLADAIAANDSARIDFLLADLELLGEVQRVRAVRVGWATVRSMLRALARAAGAMLT